MTTRVEMTKELIGTSDIEALTGLAGLQPVVLVEESGDIFVDLVHPESKKFFRIGHTKDKNKGDRVFRSIATACKLLGDEAFPEFAVKYNREFAGPEWIHVERKQGNLNQRIDALEKRYMELASQMRKALNSCPDGEPVEFPEGLHDEFQAVSNELRNLRA